MTTAKFKTKDAKGAEVEVVVQGSVSTSSEDFEADLDDSRGRQSIVYHAEVETYTVNGAEVKPALIPDEVRELAEEALVSQASMDDEGFLDLERDGETHDWMDRWEPPVRSKR